MMGVVYDKEPKWTKDSIMNELNSKVLAEQAELSQVLFGKVLIQNANGDIEITSKTVHRDNLDYYIRYLNSPHASSLATGCRTEYWNKRYDEILTELSRVKNGKHEKITFANVFVYNPINWMGSTLKGTLKGTIGVVGEGVLTPVLGALGNGLFTTVQSSLGLQDAHFMFQLSAALVCYLFIVPAIISATGVGSVVKNKITQGLLPYLSTGSDKSKLPSDTSTPIPGSAKDPRLSPRQIKDADEDENRLIVAKKTQEKSEEEFEQTQQEQSTNIEKTKKLNLELLANKQGAMEKLNFYQSVADKAELDILRKMQAEMQAKRQAPNQQVTPYNRPRQRQYRNQASAAGGADSDDEFGGGKRANKKRATKKHGKRKSKRNAKGGARKPQTHTDSSLC